MKRILLLLGLIGFIGIQAQNVVEDLPPNAEFGKCYAKSSMPDVYETKVEDVVVTPLSTTKVRLPATYKTVFDTIVAQPKSFKAVKSADVYETIVEEVMVTPVSYKWVKAKTDAACLSPNPKDCEVLALVEVPAVYKKTERKVLKSEGKIENIELPTEFKVVPRKVVDQPERIEDKVSPAVYKSVKNTVLVSKGEKVWREVACKEFLTKEKIVAIQKSLTVKGYATGPADGIIGNRTKAALIKFQKDSGIAQGNLTLETLDLLGIR